MIRGFNRLFCMKGPLSIPSARYTDKADGTSGNACGEQADKANVTRFRGAPFPAAPEMAYFSLTRVQFDDQRFVDVGSDLVTLRERTEGAFELLGINRHPAREANLVGQRQGFGDTGLLAGFFAH